MAKKSNKKGFTLVELVIVVAILAVLATVAIPAITPLTTDAKANVDAVNAKTIESVLKLAVVEASKDSSTEVELDVQQVYNAIYEANLNIKSSSFVYNTATGAVAPMTDENSSGSGNYSIAFGEADSLTVTGAGTPADTYKPEHVPDNG